MFAPPIKAPKAKTASQAAPAYASKPHLTVGSLADCQSQAADSDRVGSRASVPSPSWDFSKVPLFASDRPSGPEARPTLLQRKLAVGQVNDPLEHEADRVAEQVMRMPEPALQRKCACGGACPRCQSDQQRTPQMKRMGRSHVGPTAAPPIVHEALGSSGQPLDSATRAYFEPRFGHDFGDVRVHSDALAAQSADAVHALAYTVGRDVVFARSRYAPDTAAGQRLLAHELAHTVQQEGAGSPTGSLLLRSPLTLNRLSVEQLVARAKEIFRRAGTAYLDATGRRATLAQLKREFTVGVLQGVKDGEIVTLIGVNDPKFEPYLERAVAPGERIVPSVELTAHNLRTDLPKKTGHAHAHAEPPLSQAAKAGGLTDSLLASSIPGCPDCVAQMAEHSPGVTHGNPKVASRGSITPSESIARPVTTTAVDIDPAQRYRGGRTPPRDVGRSTVTLGEIAAGDKSVATVAGDVAESVTIDESAKHGMSAGQSAVGPKPVLEPEPGLWARAKAGIRAGTKAGLKEAFSAGNIAATVIPDALLRVADVAAAREAIRKIQIKFTKEGFAKGVAAGVAGWSYTDANLNLKNRVTPFRLRGMEDPGGLLGYSRILQVAEAYENLAVDFGYEFSSSKTLKWREKKRADGLAELAKRGYRYPVQEPPAVKRVHLGNMIVEEELDPAESGPPQYLFTNDFIDKLAWVLRPYTDSKIKKLSDN